VLVGIEATGAMQWFFELLDELGIECRVGHPAKIRAQERGSRSMIGGMHACCWSCSARIAFRKLPLCRQRLKREHPTCTERQSLIEECGWKGGDSGPLGEEKK
jgi:hypothetical protein